MLKDKQRWKVTFKPEAITYQEVKDQLSCGKALIMGKSKTGFPTLYLKPEKHVVKSNTYWQFIRLVSYIGEKLLVQSNK